MKSRTNTVGFIIRGIVIPFFILVLGVALILIGYNNILEQTAQKRAYILLANSAREQSTLMEERVSSSFQQLEIISASLDSDGNGDIYSESDLPEPFRAVRASFSTRTEALPTARIANISKRRLKERRISNICREGE